MCNTRKLNFGADKADIRWQLNDFKEPKPASCLLGSFRNRDMLVPGEGIIPICEPRFQTFKVTNTF